MSRYIKYFMQAKKLDKRKRKYHKYDFLELSKELSIPYPLREVIRARQYRKCRLLRL